MDEAAAREKEPVLLSSAPLEGDEKTRALDLVEEMQEDRASHRLKPSEVPNVLLTYQARWHADTSPVRIGEKSRRIGFSWGCLAAESVIEAALARDAGGMNQHYMGYNQAMAAEYVGDCAFFARAFGQAMGAIDVWRDTVLVEDERRDILRYVVKLSSGFRIEAHSSNPYNWRGKQGHARIDEAAFHENLREVIKGALAFRMWGGRVDIVSTHNGEDNDFAEFLRDVLAGKLPWSHHRVTFDDALREGFYRRVCLIKNWIWSQEAEGEYREGVRADYPDAEDAAEELDCVPKRGSGAYFTRLIIEPCQDDTIPIVRHSRPAEFVLDADRKRKTQDWIEEVLAPIVRAMPTARRTALGRDFGRSGDLSVDFVLQEEGAGVWRQAFQLELRNIPFDVQWQITEFLLTNLPLLQNAKFDSRGNGQEHAEKALQLLGPSFVELVMLSAGWYAEWFPRYRRAFENKQIRVNKSEDTIQDHRLVVLRDGKPAMSAAKVKGSDGKDRHGDSAVAGVLAWAAAIGDGTQPPAGSTVEKTADTFRPEARPGAERGPMLARPSGTEWNGGRRRWV
ncbi:terminase large subunit domain-containing protein [Shumkonia mesophila]|uniref:terminase large subunit domain-containing protein n=1 Tax=Shumkonia mesophila TaxID=2838854 RepID=UPI0029348AD4|nr:terminase family protein [Shumkonia mesophila]